MGENQEAGKKRSSLIRALKEGVILVDLLLVLYWIFLFCMKHPEFAPLIIEYVIFAFLISRT